MKQLTVNLDAVVLVALVLLASLGMNAWQLLQGRSLLHDYVDAEWALGDAQANVVLARSLLRDCDPEKYADLDVNP